MHTVIRPFMNEVNDLSSGVSVRTVLCRWQVSFGLLGEQDLQCFGQIDGLHKGTMHSNAALATVFIAI